MTGKASQDRAPQLTTLDQDVLLERLGIADDLGMVDGQAAVRARRIAELDAATARLPGRIRENAAVRAALDCFGGHVVSVRSRPAKAAKGGGVGLEGQEGKEGQAAGDGSGGPSEVAAAQPGEQLHGDGQRQLAARAASPARGKAEQPKVEVRAVGQSQAAALWADVIANNKRTT